MRTFKPSKAAWLDTIPSDWSEAPLFTYFRERKRKNIGLIESNVLSLSYGHIKRRNVDSGMGLLPESFETYQIVEPGDIVMRLTDLQNDHKSLRTGLVDERGIVTSAYLALIPGVRVDPRFCHYLLHALDTMKVYYGLGAGVRQTMKYGDLSSIPLATPVRPKQAAIADFLDAETDRIRNLIDCKQQFIGLLLEKRTALITHAVTKGLDPNVEMKDSGVDVVGMFPKKWRLLKAAHGFESVGSGTTPQSERPDYYDGPIPWVTTSELRESVITETSKSVTDSALCDYPALKSYPPGSVVVAMYGATIGRLGQLGINATVNQACCVFSGETLLNYRYFYYSLWALRPSLLVTAFGGTQPNLSQEDLRTMRVPEPPLGEQKSIATFLDRQTAKLDDLVDRTRESIELLKEYRTALISAAVTGQIDVTAPDDTEEVA